jgi:hypothetical protein
MNLQILQNAGNFLPSRGTVSFSGRPLLHGVSKSVPLCKAKLGLDFDSIIYEDGVPHYRTMSACFEYVFKR